MDAPDRDMPRLYFGCRLLARLLDFLFVALLATALGRLFPHASLTDAFGLYLLYNLMVSAVGGKTLGRFAFLLHVAANRPEKPGALLLTFREVVFIFLFPFICINLLGFPQRLLHDRICNTWIVKEDR